MVGEPDICTVNCEGMLHSTPPQLQASADGTQVENIAGKWQLRVEAAMGIGQW